MTTVQASEFNDVLRKVQIWPMDLRKHLVEEIIQTLQKPNGTNNARPVAATEVQGIAAGTGTPPNDETVDRWLEEHRAEKYG